MTNADFIKQAAQMVLSQTEWQKRYWSLYYKDWVLYSYGLHYPLMFMVNGRVFVNTAWYSNTTSKHIWLARRAGHYNVKLPRTVYGKPTLNQVKEALYTEKINIEDKLWWLKRRGTQIESILLRELEEVNNTITQTL